MTTIDYRHYRITILLIINLLIFATFAFGQSERKSVRQGNREFKKGEFMDSEISYRSAIDANPSSLKGVFNLGGALYKQDKFEESTSVLDNLANSDLNPEVRSKVYHNLGNSYFNQQKFNESVEAYKQSLRINPNDLETKYNLAQAQRMLIQQEDQQNQDQNNEDNENDNQEDEKENQNNENQQDQQNKDQQQNQQQEHQISPEDARRMLEAIQNNEQKIQERVKEQQAKQAKVKVEKNW